MANKNHQLDDRITDAALREFLDLGFEKASLRKIAANADVTVGAIYTRYKTKDSLFCSLINPLLGQIGEVFSEIRSGYYDHCDSLHPEYMEEALKQESDLILRLLFDHYDSAVLLLCRSRGSSMEHFFDEIIQKKIQETIFFFQNSGMERPDEQVLKILIRTQFHMYEQIINEGYELETAKKIMHEIMLYHTGGWMTLLGIQNPSDTL